MSIYSRSIFLGVVSISAIALTGCFGGNNNSATLTNDQVEMQIPANANAAVYQATPTIVSDLVEAYGEDIFVDFGEESSAMQDLLAASLNDFNSLLYAGDALSTTGGDLDSIPFSAFASWSTEENILNLITMIVANEENEPFAADLEGFEGTLLQQLAQLSYQQSMPAEDGEVTVSGDTATFPDGIVFTDTGPTQYIRNLPAETVTFGDTSLSPLLSNNMNADTLTAIVLSDVAQLSGNFLSPETTGGAYLGIHTGGTLEDMFAGIVGFVETTEPDAVITQVLGSLSGLGMFLPAEANDPFQTFVTLCRSEDDESLPLATFVGEDFPEELSSINVVCNMIANNDNTGIAINIQLTGVNVVAIESSQDEIESFLDGTNDIDTDMETGTTSIVDLAVATPSLSTLVTAVQAAGLVDTLDNTTSSFTVLAPTNAAFEELGAEQLNELLQDPEGALTDILFHHVIDGEVLASDLSDGLVVETINGATLTVVLEGDDLFFVNEAGGSAQVQVADLAADNGVVHVIDSVLVPSPFDPESNTPDQPTIAELAADTETLSTLITAVEAAELAATLSDESAEYTVLAPTNDAFSTLGDTINDLLADPTGTLQQILLYHVIEGTVLSSDLADGQVVQTVQGASLTVSIEGSSVFFVDETGGRSQVLIPDVAASNGVVHIVDTVLLLNE